MIRGALSADGNLNPVLEPFFEVRKFFSIQVCWQAINFQPNDISSVGPACLMDPLSACLFLVQIWSCCADSLFCCLLLFCIRGPLCGILTVVLLTSTHKLIVVFCWCENTMLSHDPGSLVLKNLHYFYQIILTNRPKRHQVHQLWYEYSICNFRSGLKCSYPRYFLKGP